MKRYGREKTADESGIQKVQRGRDNRLFPYMPWNAHGNAVTSYMHTGQHAAADYAGVIAVTRPATAEEYRELLAELTSVGYDNLHILRRQTQVNHKVKRRWKVM